MEPALTAPLSGFLGPGTLVFTWTAWFAGDSLSQTIHRLSSSVAGGFVGKVMPTSMRFSALSMSGKLECSFTTQCQCHGCSVNSYLTLSITSGSKARLL